MNQKQLVKLIKTIVDYEIKKQLPVLVKKEVDSILTKSNKKSVEIEEMEEPDMFSLAEDILKRERGKKEIIHESESVIQNNLGNRSLSKNPLLDQILKETKPFSSKKEVNENFQDMDKTVQMDSNGAQLGRDGLRAMMASKMGYSDMIESPGPRSGGLGVNTGVPMMDKVLNRDYTALVKKFKK